MKDKMMTVGELKKLLEKFEDEQTILVRDTELIYCEIDKVYETTYGVKISIRDEIHPELKKGKI